MDFPPEEWVVFAATDFNTAAPRFPGERGVELMAQVRSNGRIMDHWRMALGGSKVLEATFPLSTILPAAAGLPAWHVTYQQFPRDIVLRRNMLSGAWIDAVGLLSSHEFLVADAEEQPVDIQQVITAIKALPAKQNTGASIRWSVVATITDRLELQLQSLPCAANQLTGKPIFNRYTISKKSLRTV